MNKTLLIISTTTGNNLVLANKLDDICSNNIDSEIINLEEYDIPLYTPIQEKKCIPVQIESIIEKFIDSSGFIICAPEYNGSIPPILTSAIAWLSVAAKDWRLVFNGKVALIATHSGGGGTNLIQSLRVQLNHLGTIVMPRTIIVNSNTPYNEKSSQAKIQQLIDLL